MGLAQAASMSLIRSRTALLSQLLATLLIAGCSFDPMDGDDEVGEESLGIVVCGESIQAAIDSAPPGAILNICAGTYRERLVIRDKSLTLRGTSGAASTIIDADDLGAVLDVGNPGG
jgi:hypothetical protein